jgi:hypothetical protein
MLLVDVPDTSRSQTRRRNWEREEIRGVERRMMSYRKKGFPSYTTCQMCLNQLARITSAVDKGSINTANH